MATASAALSSLQSRPQLFSTLCRFAAAELVRRGDFAECHVAGFPVDLHKKLLPLFLRCMDMEIMTPKTVEMRADELRATSTARSMLRSIVPLILRAEGISATLRTIMPLRFNCAAMVFYAV